VGILSNSASSVAFSPDGTIIVYSAVWDNKRQLYLRDIRQLEAKPISGTEGAYAPFFSPSGEWIGYSDYGARKLMKVPLRGGTPIIICEAMPPNRGASWGFDDSIAFNRSYTSGLYLVSAAGGTPQAITNIDFEKKEKTHRFPQILPDGKTVLFTIGTSEFTSYDDSLIAIVSLETGKRKILFEGGSNAKYAQSGHIVYAGAGSLMAVPFNLKRLEVTGSPVRILDGIVTSDAIGVAQFSFSRSGSLIYATGGPEVYYTKLVWVDRKGEIRSLPVTPRSFVDAQCSPDGKRLALHVRGGNEDVWIYEIEREILTRLTYAGGDNQFPIWTPDSNRVTYLNSIGGVYALVWKPADGSGFAEKLITSEHRLNPTSWSPDGKMLAFTESHLSTGADIWVLTIEGERKPQLFLKTSSDETGAKFSPNGRWMAYSSNESGKFEVYVRPFPGPGRKWQISTEGGKSPVWAPDSRELFYRTEDKMMVVAIKTKPEFSAGKPKLLFKAPSNLFNMGIAPDGQRFVMIEEAEYSTLPTQLNIVLNWFEELKRLVPTGK
jgi:serine/threonine-protein kinase